MNRWVILMPLLMSCIGPLAARARGAHEVLNVTADIVNPSYELASQVCDAREQVVIERQGTSLEQDTADIEHIRASCDAVFKEFEHIRAVHELARVAIEEAENGESWEDVETALANLAGVWNRLTMQLRTEGLWPVE